MKKKFFIGLMTVLITLSVGLTDVFAQEEKPCKPDLCPNQFEVEKIKLENQKDVELKKLEVQQAEANVNTEVVKKDKAQAEKEKAQAEKEKVDCEQAKAEAEAEAKEAENKKLESDNTLKGKPWDTVGNNGVVGSIQAFQAILQTTGDTNAGLQYRLLSGQTGVQIDMEFPEKWPDFSAGKKGLPYWAAAPIAVGAGAVTELVLYFIGGYSAQTQALGTGGVVVGTGALSLLISVLTN